MTHIMLANQAMDISISRLQSHSGDKGRQSRAPDLNKSDRALDRENDPCLGYNSTDLVLADR